MSFWDDRANELGLSQNTAENHVSSDVPRRQQASPSSYSSDEYYRIYGPQPEDNKPSQFKAGLLAGWDQLQAMGGGLQAMAGQAFDKPDWVDSGIETYNRNMEEAANRGATETSFTDLFADDEPLTFGRAADWAAYTVGNLAPTMASMLVSGGVGSLAAKEIIKRGSAKAIQALAEKRTAQLVASGVAKEAAEKEALKYAVKHTTAKAAEYGMMTGAGAGSVAMETGSIAGDMQNELGQIDTGTALIHGTAAGLLDALPFMRVMRQMGIAGIARKEIIDSIPKTILKTALAEGGTEAAQTIIERHAIKWLDDSKDIFTDDGWKDIIDSAAAGFLGGGVMGAPAAVAGKRANPEDDITDKLTEDADGPDPAKVNINRYQAFLDRAKGANDKRHATAAAAKQAEEDKKQFGIFTQRLNLDDQFGAYDDQEFRLNSIRAARESARAKGGDQLSQAIAGGEGLLLSLRNSQRSIEPAPLEGELLDRQNALPNLPPQLPGNGFINGETQPAGLLGTPPNFYMGGPIAGNRNNGLDQQATVVNRSDNLAPQLSMKSFADNLDWTATKARRTARLPVNLQDQRLLNESYRTALTELAHNAQTTVKSNPNSKSVDIHSDDLLTAIAKLGGVDRNELAKDGVDLEDMKKVRRGIRPVFSVKGRSLDDLAETLAEDGYLNSRDVNELDSKIRDMLAGQAHYSNARDPSLDIQSDIASEANQSYDGRKTHSTVLNATDFDAQPAAVQEAINKAMNGERLGSAQARIVNEALEAIKQARSGVIDRAKLFRDAGRTIRRELKRSQDLLNRPNAPIDAYSEAESTIDEQGISPEDAELMLMIAEAQDAGVPDHVIDYLEASTRNDQDFLSGIKREIKRAAPNGNRQSESETNNGGIRAGDQGRQDNPRGHDSRTQEESAGEGPALELATYTEKELKQQQAQREARQKAEAEAQAKEEAKAKAESQVDDFSLTGSERQADANQNQADILDLTAAEAKSEPDTSETSESQLPHYNNNEPVNANTQATTLYLETLSDKAFVVKGDTLTHKDKLKALRGMWNRKANGWMFPEKRRTEIEQAISEMASESPPTTKQATKQKTPEKPARSKEEIEAEKQSQSSDSISDAQSDSKLGVNNDDDKRAGSRREGSETLGRVVAGDDAGTKGQRRMGEGDEAGRDQGSRDDSGADAAGVSSPRSGRGGAKSVHSIETGSPRPGRRTGKGAGRNGGGVSELGGADVQPGAIAPPSIPAANFVIDESVRLGQGGEVEKFNDNLNAIRIVKTLLREARRATPDEQRALARYVGWGGLANAFADADGNYKKGWEARGKALAELLSDKELAAARRSTRNAHYTSETIISAMYDAVKQLGHQGGLMLEPSAGTGNFIGLAPSGMDNRVIAVEYDPITAKIAEALYPQATVLHSGFQKVPLADGAFDLVIGNPPFGSESLRFPFKPWLNSHSIHNQFFIAAMDALKPNGVMAMVVSRYLLDAQSSDARKELARRGKLLGAIRLPDSAFKENARTEVVTDIIFMQRHDPETERLIRVGEEKLEGLPWLETVEVPDPQGGDAIRVNAYFAKNPHMILGSLERSGSMRVQNDVTVKLAPGELVQRLSEAVGRLPKNVVTATEGAIEAAKQRHEQMSAALQLALAGAEQGAILREDGQLVRVNEQKTPEGGYELVKQVLTPASPWSSTLELDEHGRWYKSVPALDDKGDKVKDKGKNVYVREVYQDEKDIPSSLRLGESRHERLLVLAELRDTLNQQLQLEADDESKAKIEANRKVLAKQYKDFVQAHGPINANRNLLLLTEMPDGALLMALEKSYNPEEKEWTGEYKGKNKTKVYRKVSDESAVPADILAARMVFPYKKPAHAETPTDALAITLAEGGRVNLDRIAELLGMTPEEAKRVMYDDATTPLIFPDPESGLWETRDAYLSGNVARKLRAAKESGDRKAVEELVKVQPAPIKAENVAVQVSASWVPDNIYADFLTHLTGGRAQVKRLTATNSYSVSGDGTTAKAKEWGTERASVVKLVDDLLNNRQTRVIDYDSDGKAHPNQAETELANLKRDQIASEFNEWVFMDGLRRAQLVEIFNELFNTRVTRQHDGSHLILPGKVPDTVIKMRRHQLNAIWRGISERFILMDHAVGAGKTFTAIARAIERKRMGLSRKPMVVVPNHMVEQFAADALRLYPGANVLAAGKKGFEKKKRRKLFARIATGDWDLVIVPHSSFEFIPLSPETEERYLMIELEKAIAAVKEAEEQAREDDHNSFRKPFNVKEAERMKESVENRLDKLRTTRKDRLLTFEQMGVDDLTVDEAHEFKNLFYHTRTTGVRGMGNKAGSQKAFDLYNKVRVLADSPTGSVAFLTGTPISNSAVEMYTIMRYLAGKELQELGLDHFDAWRAQFVGISTKYEPTEDGRLKEVNRLGRSWSNMKSLMDLYQGVADMVSNDDIKQTFAEDNPGKQYPLPKVKGGKRQSVVVKPTQAQEKILKQVLFDYDLLDSITNPEDRNRERLRLMDRARKLSLDARAANPGEKSPEEGGKLDAVADNVAALYKQWNDERGTQLVFLDRSVPSSKGDKKVIKAYGDLIAKRDQALADNDETAYRRIIERLDAYNPDEIESLRGAQSGGWNAYEQIKQNLIKRGIPEKEIRFIQEANTDQQKQELFDAVNEGSVRVLIGSTTRMGAGTNVQKRLVGLHHVDVTWKPSDIEQREGRIIRQGNLIGFDKHGNIIRPDFEVSILAYVTERTMDAKMWDLNSTKLAMINAIRQYNGEFTMEFDDSESDAVNMEEIAALATGDPKMLERVTLKGEIDKLMLLERAHRRKQWGYADALREYERIIETYPDRIHAMQENIGRLQDAIASVEARSLARSVTVQGKNIHLRFDAEREIKGWIDAQQAGNPKARYSVKVNGKNLSSRVEIARIIQSAFGDQGFEVLIGKREYISALDAGREIGAKLSSLAKGLADGDQSRSVAVGVMYGMTLEVDVMRDGNYFASLSLTDKAGAVVVSTEVSARNEPEYSPALIKNALSTLVSEVYSCSNVANLDRLNRALENAKKELPETKEKYGKPFDKAAELQEKRDRLAALTSELASEKVSAKAEEAQDEAVTQASVGSLVDADKPSFTAIARDELEQAIAPVLRQTGQTVKIVDSYHELPPAARAKVAKLGGLAWDFIWGRLKGVRLSLDAGEVPKLVPGVYHEGTYYAIREFTPNAEVSARTALHELVGHKGVNRVLGDEAGKIFRQIARSMPDAMREELKARYNLKDTDADLAELGSEYVAKLSEEDARPTTVQFVVAKIRHILRKLFPKLSWNKADALYLIERGRKALEKNSAEMDARETAAMESFDKAEGLANATPFSQSISDILSKQSDTAKDKVLDALLDNKFAEGFKKSSLALLTLRQLGDVAKKILPQINTYVGVVHEMLTDRNQMAEQAANIVDAWQAWAAKNRKEADKLADLMHAATIDGVDPSLAFESMTDNITKRIGLKEDRIAVIERKDRSTYGTAALMNEKKKIENEIKELKKDLLAEPGRRNRHAALVPEWNALTPEAKAFYKKARDEYGKQNERMLKILQARIQGVDLNGTTIDGATKKRLLAELRLEFEAQRIQVYFPLSRFGKYYLDTQDKDGKRVYLMFETEREQQRVMKEMEKQGYDVSKHGHMLDKRREESASLSFIKELSDSIDNLNGYDADEKDTIRDSIYQVYLRHLPDRSIRKAHIHRKKVAGYSTDAIRAFADTMMKNAYQLARLQRMDELSGLMTEMEQAAGPKSSPGNAKGIFYNEMQKRHDWVMNPKHSAIAHKLTGLGFIWMLGVSPAAAAINLTQTPVVAGPVLASKYGKGAWSELLSASRLFNVKSGSMLEKLTDQKERDAFMRWRDMGLLDSTRAHDLAGIAEHGGYEYSPTQHKIMTGISALFHRAEQFNREVTALAAFRLAMKKHGNYEQAVKEAAELTWDSHFDYSNVNRARFMQSGFMKVATQFKQYSQNITYYMLRNLHQMIKGESAEVKKQARQQLLGTLAMTGLIGGINALPLWALYAVANAIFGDDDEPYDAQTELYTYLSDTLGKDMADEIIYGAGGAGVSPRISLSGLWFRDSNRELEGEDAWSFYAQQAVGPVLGGIVPGFFEGMRKAGDGEYARAFENFVPKFVKDAAKTVRYFREGALNTKGDELKAEEDFSMVDLVLQLSGFADSDVSKQYAENAAIKGYERHILERRKRLMTKYYLAQKDGDSGEKLEVQQMIARFNKRWPEIRIDNKALRNSIKSRERARDNAQHGININPKLEQSLSRIDWAN